MVSSPPILLPARPNNTGPKNDPTDATVFTSAVPAALVPGLNVSIVSAKNGAYAAYSEAIAPVIRMNEGSIPGDVESNMRHTAPAMNGIATCRRLSPSRSDRRDQRYIMTAEIAYGIMTKKPV